MTYFFTSGISDRRKGGYGAAARSVALVVLHGIVRVNGTVAKAHHDDMG
ncbi:hypothetical protein [Methylovulum miyakonense]|nr:hypothetical protein [Methylovulum miyakonense]